MRKNNLLAAAAIAGLIGGTSLAIGQSSNSSGVGSGNAGAGAAAPSSAERSSPNSGPAAGSGAKQGSEQRSETGSSATGSQSSERRNQAAGQTGTAGQAGQASSPGQDRDGRSGATANSGSAAKHGSASLTSEQRTKIRQTIVRQGNAPRVANVNFSVSVGTTVPRSVRLVAVPVAIVEIQPAWRGYEYFMVGDQVVIVDPDTMQIVAIISA